LFVAPVTNTSWGTSIYLDQIERDRGLYSEQKKTRLGIIRLPFRTLLLQWNCYMPLYPVKKKKDYMACLISAQNPYKSYFNILYYTIINSTSSFWLQLQLEHALSAISSGMQEPFLVQA
jgi:hypothetical protein